MDTILVLGASGFIGHHLIERLLQCYRVVGYSRSVPNTFLSNKNYIHLAGNFALERDFNAILRQYQVSCIYHGICTTTPQEGTAHIAGEGEENIIPTLRLLEAASKYEGMRLIFLSSGGTVYGENLGHPSKIDEEGHPICTYGIQKRVIEEYIRYYSANSNIHGLIARISNPYGVMEKIKKTQGIIPIFLDCLQKGKGITLFGNTVRDYVYIDDVVEALITLKDYPGHEIAFNIGSGAGISLSELVLMIERVTNKKFSSIDHKDRRSCDVMCNILDISKTQEILKWNPSITLEDGISKIWNYYSLKNCE